MPRKILIIEDDKDIARLLEHHLTDIGYEVRLAHDGNNGLAHALSRQFDMIILALTIPAVDGLEICRQVRATPCYTPMLMLSSGSTELDRVLGLETGADDYVTKPFGIRELLARVKALFRRVDALRSELSQISNDMIRTGHLAINVATREVLLDGKPVLLTAKEFDLLLHFARNPGRVFKRRELLKLVWGYGYEGYERTVTSHINRLRAKIEKEPNKPRFILSVRGIGYKFSDS
jgi:DNA-binding response OmpR family regulator